MKIEIQNGLPFVRATITHAGKQLRLNNVLVDTGSASTIFATDQLLSLGVHYAPEDEVHRIRGVGGTEFVFARQIASLAVEDLQTDDFTVEIGLMDYGFVVDGIIGMDFLLRVGAVIDLKQMAIYSA
jgi:hypothetical protein